LVHVISRIRYLWMVTLAIFITLGVVYFRSAPVFSLERLLSPLTPCPLNTSRVVGKHRRVVWYLLLIADTDRPFQSLIIIESIIIATVTRPVERVCTLRSVGSRRTLIFHTPDTIAVTLVFLKVKAHIHQIVVQGTVP